MILQDYDLQKSLNFFDRQFLTKFYDLFVRLVLKQKLNSIRIAVTNIGH